ncbi:hypothetical protein B0H63DRAFT_472800 [Podospora didyma]|uniref:Uncharacterized protein n=1 Tax=Podospora didyma TaxID=330526 RepID=A0AAE0NPL3_9PEZI|nr:hypothetical protein B0H63DRAFT_472800 [Podospora didyma]
MPVPQETPTGAAEFIANLTLRTFTSSRIAGNFAWDLLDAYAVPVFESHAPRVMQESERFELVSSLYGPGAFICWLCVIASVLVSWTLNPVCRRKDSISNDYMAALTLPLIAAVHFFHQNITYEGPDGDRRPLTKWYPEAVKFGAAVEAPMAVCEVFTVLGLALFGIAAWNRLPRRATAALLVTQVCASTGLALLVLYTAAHPRTFNYYRCYNANFAVSAAILGSLMSLHGGAYFMETATGHIILRLLVPTHLRGTWGGRNRRDTDSSWETWRRQPGRISGALAAGSVAILGFVTLYIKYHVNQAYKPMYTRTMGLKFIPHSSASAGDLDQVAAILGGVVTLGLSIRDSIRERRRERVASAWAARETALRVWGT